MLGKNKLRSKVFPIVAIGASAGGLEAVTALLKNLPADTGMAYIYIQHQAREHKSKLVEILSRATKMKVVTAKNLLPIEANRLHILPPDKDMSIIDGSLKLIPRQPKPSLHLPINKFFLSLAENQKEGAIGVLLSGSANDGTIGLKAIKSAGGLTFVQDDSAQFQGMPKSAIADGYVDKVLSPQELAKELGMISKNKSAIHEVLTEPSEEDLNNEDLAVIIQVLKKSTGVDFKHYKVNTIRRRIIRRMLLHKLETFGEYAKYLKQHNEEATMLYQDLLINVTAFFRDLDTVEYLKKTLLPKIIKHKSANEPVRLWVPACSTGEEAYSLAIILMEILNDKFTNIPVQIFATDLSETAIAKARLGLYTKNDLLDVSPKRLQRFFTKVDGSYRVIKPIRDLCVFAPHNVLKDPPFSRLDLISCCNLMIYFDAVLQKRIISTFHYALNSNGYLVLGKSETIGTSGQLFTQVEKKFKIYARKNDAGSRAKFELNKKLGEPSNGEPIKHTDLLVNKKNNDNRLERNVDEILLAKYVPASVVINQDLEILQFRGSTGFFLEPSPGKASLNLLKMARAGLSFELRSIFHKTLKSGKPTKKTGIDVKYNNATFQASIEIVPLAAEEEEKLFLVVFTKLEIPVAHENSSSISKDKIVKQLQTELETIKEDMRSMLEEQEANVEELQSANEEVVSSNEELQSINEELETSKEEVESTNEELLTINSELQVRNEQLAESYEYAEAVFETIREAVLILDHDFHVRSANKAFYRIFRTAPERTEGVLLYELGNRQWDIHRLRQLLDEIVLNNSSFVAYEVAHDFPDIGEKVMLLTARTLIQKIHRKQIVLLAIEDITEHRRAQTIISERETWFRNMANNAPVMIWLSGLDKKRNFFNNTWLEFTGYQPDSVNTEIWKEAIHPEDLKRYMDVYTASFLERKTFQAEYRLRRNDGEYRWMMDVARPTFSGEGAFLGYIGSCTEIHHQKLMHEELEKHVKERTQDLLEANQELQRSNSELQQFAYVASHDLQEPLRKIMTFIDRLSPMMGDLADQGKFYFDKINESSQRMTRLIDDLLDYSRISRSEKKFVKTDLYKVVKEVLVDFEHIINQKNAKITIGDLPTLQTVPVQIERLFHNLISNAFKFSKNDEVPEISIQSRELAPAEIKNHKSLDKNLTYFEITVKDNGIGFPMEFAEQIFVIFQRLNDKSAYPGTGMGLAICKRIVTNHTGEIFAVAEENQGAEFHVLLPFKQGKNRLAPPPR